MAGKNKRLGYYARLLYIPLALFITYLLVILLWKLFNLPTNERLVEIVTEYFNNYGLITVFIGALIEGFFLLGQYFPGGLIIFLGVISAGRNIPRVIWVVILVMIAFFISYTLNYLVGKYGWYKLFVKFGLKKPLEDAQKRLRKRGLSSILLSYWEPNLASIMATAAGTLKLEFKKFLLYSLIGILIWETFWGIVVFYFGNFVLNMGLGYVIVALLIWIGVIFITEHFRNRSNKLGK